MSRLGPALSRLGAGLPYLVVFLACLYPPGNPDLGWHLKYGEHLVWQNEILRENVFSSEMPHFQWVNHSWLSDLVGYGAFAGFGFAGLSVLGALLMTGAAFCLARGLRLSRFEQALLFGALVYFETPVVNISFRAQLISLLGVAALVGILGAAQRRPRRFIFVTVPLFVLWSNLHGEFVLGLGLFLGWIVLSLLRDRFFPAAEPEGHTPVGKEAVLALGLSGLAAMAHPFGWRVYGEALRHFHSPATRVIQEFQPFPPGGPHWWHLVGWGVLLLLGAVLAVRQKRLAEVLPFAVLAGVLYLVAFGVRRYAWPMLIVSIPLLRSIPATLATLTRRDLTAATSVVLVAVAAYLGVRARGRHVFAMSWERYCQSYIRCSPASAEALTKHPPPGPLLTFYGWGGWLIWNYPAVKPSIDGRMALWTDPDGHSAFNRYHALENNQADIDQSGYAAAYLPPFIPLFKQLVELSKAGKWRPVYGDGRAFLFVRTR